ncbi:hypothetical protein EVAR_57976_1 [Eumeta japonica]|uniref:Uncharacterized protein n=1 Tax=Eumeta variegata TaxID=151549 RepID=A0A4C1XZL1_EUMVA|nr:hypothetical protein EVAR_57976_1 [Eumeta japonica]
MRCRNSSLSCRLSLKSGACWEILATVVTVNLYPRLYAEPTTAIALTSRPPPPLCRERQSMMRKVMASLDSAYHNSIIRRAASQPEREVWPGLNRSPSDSC